MPSSTEENVLLLAALAPFVPFVPLTLWAHRHPVDALDVKIEREMQKDKGCVLSFAMLTMSHAFGLAMCRVAICPVLAGLASRCVCGLRFCPTNSEGNSIQQREENFR